MPHPQELTVAQAAAAIRLGQLSPVELVESLLKRIDSLEPKLNAWAYVAREHALKAAAEAERDANSASARSPVFGVPFGAKDIFDTAGIPTEAGSEHYKGRVPKEDAGSIKRLKRAGAILLGKVHTTEFADGHPAPSRNPYNIEHSPGGSSAGSAVAVAARMVPITLGSQTVGSVLRPASFCGVVGFKPTFGRVNRLGAIPMSWSFDHVGWLALNVEDTAIFLQVLAGYDAEDPDCVNMPTDDYIGALTRYPKAPRIGLLRHFFDHADAEMRESTESAVQKLAKAGAEVDELRLSVDFLDTFKAHRAVQSSEMAAWHKPLWVNKDLYKSRTRAFLERGYIYSGVEYVEGQQLRARTREAVGKALEEVDILVSPSTSAPAPPLSEGTTGDPSFQSPWTFIGFPAITLPTGLSSKGLPTGIQFGTAAWQEAKLLGTAKWVEDTLAVKLPVPV